MKIHEVFTDVAFKRLVAVDLPHLGSHEHELNGTAALRSFFRQPAREKVREKVHWVFLEDDADAVHGEGHVTFYDARAKSVERTGRSEWRLYYTGEFLARASVGDLLVLARAANGSLFGIVARQDSAWTAALQVLLPMGAALPRLQLVTQQSLSATELGLVAQRLLDDLGLEELLPPSTSDAQLVIDRFGREFPSSAALSALAREVLPCNECDPDACLDQWLARELQLFRALEEAIIQTRIHDGFNTVDEFLSFSLSVQNRRKSRAGYALQHHAEALFSRCGLRFEAQVITERSHKPDFLFPGSAEYRDPDYPVHLLTVLAAKSSCKERWRQILAEADRLPVKNLLTLDPCLSASTVAEMEAQRVRLILPAKVRNVYPPHVSGRMLTVSTLVDEIRAQQDRGTRAP